MQILLLDVDGVLVRRSGYFSERFAREHNIPLNEILPFFDNELKQCMLGRADLKTELLKYLAKWGWKGTVDEFLKYWFDGETDLQLDVLDFVTKVRKMGIKIYLVTDNEKYRVEFLRDFFGFSKLFDGIFASFDLHADKADTKFYQLVLEAMPTVLPEDIVFTDDDVDNVEAAKSLGIKGFLFIDLENFKNQLAQFS